MYISAGEGFADTVTRLVLYITQETRIHSIENHFMFKQDCNVLKLLIVYKFSLMPVPALPTLAPTRSLKMFSDGG